MLHLHQPYVLLLDDDHDDHFFARYWLDKLNIQIPVHFLDDPFALFPWLDEQERLPALIVLDKRLPGMEGLELLKQLKAHERYACIPVIILSGTGFPEEVSAYYAAGASSFILKPKDGGPEVAAAINHFVQYWFHLCQLPHTTSVHPSSSPA